ETGSPDPASERRVGSQWGEMAAPYKCSFKFCPTGLGLCAMSKAIQRRAFVAAALVGLTTRAGAQDFPSKPLRWIIPFAAGGNYDVTSRLVGEAMGRRIGQTVVPDNRPGAGGIVGLEPAANAPADGYTLVMGSFSVLWVAPYLAGKPS